MKGEHILKSLGEKEKMPVSVFFPHFSFSRKTSFIVYNLLWIGRFQNFVFDKDSTKPFYFTIETRQAF